VVGVSLTAGNTSSRGFVWTPAEGMVELVPVGGRASSYAVGINNRGEVAGVSYNPGFPVPTANIRATMWRLVADAQQQLEDAIAVIASWNLRTLGTSLPAKLEIAREFEAAGATRQACQMLNSFLNEVRAQNGKQLTVDQATELTDRAIRIQHAIGC
jgi:FIMAH domain-containing protein